MSNGVGDALPSLLDATEPHVPQRVEKGCGEAQPWFHGATALDVAGVEVGGGSAIEDERLFWQELRDQRIAVLKGCRSGSCLVPVEQCDGPVASSPGVREVDLSVDDPVAAVTCEGKTRSRSRLN